MKLPMRFFDFIKSNMFENNHMLYSVIFSSEPYSNFRFVKFKVKMGTNPFSIKSPIPMYWKSFAVKSCIIENVPVIKRLVSVFNNYFNQTMYVPCS